LHHGKGWSLPKPAYPSEPAGTISSMQIKQLNWVAVAGPVVTIAFSPTLTYEPFDNIKLLLLGVFAGIGLSGFLTQSKNGRSKQLKVVSASIAFFYLALLIPMLFSQAPLSQQIFGVAGRSLGFLHYFFLGLILLGAVTGDRESAVTNFLKGLTLTGLFESFYGILQYLKLDPINWENENNWVFGTFGNPNFLSAFVGISVSASLFMFFQNQSSRWKLLNVSNVFLGTAMAVLSDSIQGLVLIAVSVAILVIVLTFLKSKLLGIATSLASALSVVVAILGIFQIGPLTRFLYQDSTSFRGDYWRAGIAMVKENLFTGVGLDSYGDYYRQFRDATAGQRRGLYIHSDSAHNLFIDLAATGGLLLLISYLFINILVVISISRTMRASDQLKIESLALPIIWLTFQIQTLISINVSSLAIWGWITAGLILSQSTFSDSKTTDVGRGRVKKSKPKNGLIAATLAIVFMLLVFPLLRNDLRLGSALKSTNSNDLISTVSSWPRSCYLMAKAEEAYSEAGAPDLALQISLKSVESNPRCFDSWRHISKNPNATKDQQEEAFSRMRALDPFLN
jgi:O-antigen ligase